MVLDAGDSVWVRTIVFHPDGKHLLGGTDKGTLRWRLADGREVGRQMGIYTYALSVSRDHKWIVCGTNEGVSVWDGEMNERVINMESGTSAAFVVDVSPDSTRFAIGTFNVSVWSITSGQRLVGPLQHDNMVNAVRFSPGTGERIATACMENFMCIFDSHTGDKLVTLNARSPSWLGTPLAWSGDGQQISAASRDNKVRSFDVSTGFQLAESQILHDDGDNNVLSIALAANGKFIATSVAWHLVSFLDTSTLKQVGPVIKENGLMGSITISADSSYLATAQEGGKFVLRDLSNILPDSYGPFHVSSHNPGLLSPSHQC